MLPRTISVEQGFPNFASLYPIPLTPAQALLYLHIPFCQSRCIYCDFYSTTSLSLRETFTERLCREMEQRRGELPSRRLRTVYIGGGTPSQLPPACLRRVAEETRRLFEVTEETEFTVEANPDDVTPEWVAEARSCGVNRVSMGVQSLSDGTLRLLRRRHTAAQARAAVETLRAGGITDISIDLIYGLPGQSGTDFRRDLSEALALPVTHLSAYALTVEEGTPLAAMLSRGELRLPDEETVRSEYEALMDRAAEAGFEHYEISNFARPGFRSRHNSAYWDGETPYLGCGPGAHSFDGHATRRHNLPDLAAYLAATDLPPFREERLTADERYDETVFTALRTRDGLSLDAVARHFGAETLAFLEKSARPHIAAGRLETRDGRLRLTRAGIFVSDGVMSDLMRV